MLELPTRYLDSIYQRLMTSSHAAYIDVGFIFRYDHRHMPIHIHILYTYTVEDDGKFKGKLKDEIIVDKNSE